MKTPTRRGTVLLGTSAVLVAAVFLTSFTLGLLAPAPDAAAATGESAHLRGLTAVTIERPPAAAGERGREQGHPRFDELPAAVRSQLGPDTVEYESFVVTHLPPRAADALAGTLEARGIGFSREEDDERRVHLPHHSFDPGRLGERSPAASAPGLDASPVPGLWLVRFAYPIQQSWLDDLAGCGLERVSYFPQRTILVRGEVVDLDACGVSELVDWTGPYLATDRVSPEHLARTEAAGYWLEFVAGTDLAGKAEELPEGVTIHESIEASQGGMAFLRVTADAEGLAELAAADPDFLSVTEYGVGEPSDERQGSILAGMHNGASVTGAGYRSWLNGRGLLSSSNQQIVGVLDIGYDDGSFNPSNPSLEEHHLDLERPERLADLRFNPGDSAGHGTMVSGIIVGDGSLGTTAKDAQGYHLGTGIAPAAKLAVARVSPLSSISAQETAIEWVRNSASSTTRGHIINESWNERDTTATDYTPITSYSAIAQFFDQRALDANNDLAGAQRTLFVYSAGNYRQNCNGLNWNTVASPALAKNVIAVGATLNDRPYPISTPTVTNPPQDCNSCVEDAQQFGRPPEENANHVSKVAIFSGRGRFFAPYPDTRRAHNRRIKPDVVAPAARVYSTVPYAYPSYDDNTDLQVNGCTKYYPLPGHSEFGYHTYGTGTSFAAPVVSGAAALLRKKLLDSGIDPAPTLLKAGIVATADDLGDISGSGNGSDHRPSPKYGWGRVNLERLTDSTPRFYRNEVPSDAVSTGQSRSWTRTIANGNKDTYIVLAWSDAPASITSNANAVLVNDLDLRAQGGVYRGNIFNEVMSSTDDGYSFKHLVCACLNDSVNNVEAIFLPAGTFASGASISLQVLGSNVPSGPQAFSVYAYNVQ